MKKLYRSNSGIISGVCGGLGNYFNIDNSLIRILFVVLMFTPFPIIFTYLLLWVITSKKEI